MADTNLEGIILEIEATTDKADKGFDNTVKGLNQIKKAVQDIDPRQLSAFNDGLKELYSVSKNIKDIGSGLSGMSNAIKTLTNIDSTKVKSAVATLKELNGALGNLGTNNNVNIRIVNNDNISKTAKALNDTINASEKASKPMERVADSIGEVEEAAESATPQIQVFIDTLQKTANTNSAEQYEKLGSSLKSIQGMFNFSGLSNAASGIGKISSYFEMLSASGAKAGAGIEAISASLSGLSAAVPYIGIILAAITALIKGVQTAQDKFKQEFTKIAQHVQSAASTIKNAISSIVNKFQEMAGHFASHIPNLGALFDGLSAKLAKLARLGTFMLLRKGFTALFTTVGEGFNNLFLYSQMMGTQFHNSVNQMYSDIHYLGNAFFTAFEPIFNFCAPAIDFLVEKIVSAINAIAQLFGALTGAKTFTRAKKPVLDYGAALDKTSGSLKKTKDKAKKAAKAIKEIKDATLGIDELNIITQKLNDNLDNLGDNLDDPTGGGGGLGGIGDLFETVPIDDKFKDFAEWLKDMWDRGDFYELGRFLGDKLNEALNNIPWDKIKKTARKIAKCIATFLNGFLETPGLFRNIGRTLAEAINTGFEFLDSFSWHFHWKSLGKAIMDAIEGALDYLDWHIIRNAVLRTANGLADLFNEIFSRKEVFGKLGDALGNALNIAVQGLKNFVTQLHWDKVGDSIGEAIYRAVKSIDLSNLADALATGINGFANGVYHLFASVFRDNTFAKNIYESINTFFRGLQWEDVTYFDDNGEYKIKRGIKSAFAKVFGSLGQWLSDTITGIDPTEISNAIYQLISAAVSGVSAFIGNLDFESIGDNIVTALNDLIDRLTAGGELQLTAEAINKLIRGIGGILKKVITQVDWNALLTELKKAISTIDWGEAFAIIFEAKMMLKYVKFEVFTQLGLNVIGGVVKGIKEAAQNVFFAMSDTAKSCVLGFAAGLSAWLLNAPIISLVSNIVKLVKTLLGIHSPSTVFEEIGHDVILGFAQGISKFISDCRSVIQSWVKNIKEWFTGGNGINKTSWGTFASNIITGFKSKISSTYTTSKSSITTWASSIKTWFNEHCSKQKFSDIAKDVIDGFKNGIGSFYQTCKDTINTWGASIISWFKEKLNSNSPSKVFEEIGEDTVDGYNIGVENKSDAAKGTMSSLADTIINTFSNAVSPAKDAFRGLASEIDRVNEASKRLDEQTQSTRTNAEGEAYAAKALADSYFDLAEKTNKTSAEYATMREYAQKLSEVVPGLNQYINEQSGLLTAQKDKIYELIEAEKQRAISEAYYSALVESYKKLAQAEIDEKSSLEQIKSAEAELTNCIDKHKEAKDRLADAEANLKALQTNPSTHITEWGNYNAVLKDAEAKVDAARQAEENASSAYESASRNVQNLTISHAELKTALEEAQAQAEATSTAYTQKMAEMSASTNSETATMVQTFKNSQGEIVGVFSDGTTQIISAGNDAASGYAQGIGENADLATSAATDMVNDTIDAVKTAQNSHSPSVVFEGMGKDAVDGYNQGISKNVGTSKTIVNDWVNQIKDTIKNAFGQNFGADLFSGLSQNVQTSLNQIAGNVKTSMESVKMAFTSSWNGVKTEATNVWNSINQSFKSGFENTILSVRNNLITIKTEFTTVWGVLKMQCQTGWTAIRTAFSSGITTISTTVRDGWNIIKGQFVSGVAAIQQTIRSADWYGLGSYIVSGIKNGVENGWGGLLSRIRELCNQLYSEAQAALQVHSPSRLFMQLGEYVTQGLNIGIQNKEGETESTVRGLSNKVTSTFNSTLQGIKNNIQTSWNNISQTYNAGLNEVKNSGANSWNDVKNQTSNAMTGISTDVNNKWYEIRQNFTNSNLALKNESQIMWQELQMMYKLGFENTLIYIRNGWTSIKNEFTLAWNIIRNNTQIGWNNEKAAFSNGMTTVQMTVRNGWATIKSIFQSGVSSMVQIINSVSWYSLGSNVVSGLWRGIQDNWGGLISNLKNYCSQLYEQAKSALAVHSPSRLFMKLGAFLVEGLNLGISDNAASSIKTVQKWASSLTNVDFTMAASLKIDDSRLKDYEPNYGKDFTSEAIVQRISREVTTNGAVSATLNASGGLKTAFVEALTETGVVANMESTAEATKRQADKDEQTIVELDGRKVNNELERRSSANGFRFTPKPA